MSDAKSRRSFIEAAGITGAALLLGDAVRVREALAWAVQRRQAPPPHRYLSLTPGQAADLEAVASRIMPSDDTPGARDAGVIHFMDRAFTTFAAPQKHIVDKGLADLNRRVRKRWKGTSSFAALAPAQQDEVLHEIERQDFFQGVRQLTLFGMFADPSWGGNQDDAGWKLIGYDHQPLYRPPFGWYDAEANRGG